jgi:hypothetical protein
MCLGCLFAMLAVSFPRVGLLIMWIFTDWMEIAFEDNWFWPLLGLIFLPFTTLMYVFIDVGTIGDFSLWGWLMIGLGVLIDISHWAQFISKRRDGVDLYNQYRPSGADIAP